MHTGRLDCLLRYFPSIFHRRQPTTSELIAFSNPQTCGVAAAKAGMKSFSELADFYEHLTHHVVPGPNSYSYFVPFLLLPAALLTPPSVLSRPQLASLFLPAICACQIHSWYNAGGIDVISLDLTLWSFVLLVCRDPRQTHRRIRRLTPAAPVQEDRPGEAVEEVVEEAYPEKFAKRIPWVFTLLVSLRLTGWKIGDPSHDRTQPPAGLSKSVFLKHSVNIVIQSYLILDAAAYYAKTDPYFTTSGMKVDHPFPPPSAEMAIWLVMLRLLPPRLVRCSVLAGQIYAMVAGMFYIPLTLAVGLNAVGILPHEWSPHTWPLPFGHFSAVSERGLRGLWGDWWHGVNRQITAPPGRSLAQALGIQTNSLTGFALLTISAFFFSGLMHMGLIPPEPQTTQFTARWMRLHVAGFFWAQIPAFGFEVAVSKLIACFIPQALDWSATRVVVMAWTAAWLCLTLPLLTVPFRELWYWHHYPVPMSLLQGLSGKGWWTW